jgi:hypothetical protein
MMNQRYLLNRSFNLLRSNGLRATLNTTTQPSSTYSSYHVNIKSKHFVMTEEKRAFLEALKVELFGSNRSSVNRMIKESDNQRFSYSTTSPKVEDDVFNVSLENSRNLMCHKRHYVLTQQKAEYFLYL